MPFCAKCGQQYNEGVRFCPSCGAPTDQPAQGGAPQQEYQANTYQQSYQQAPTQQAGVVFTGNKTMAILAVIFPFLFFLPLVTGDKTEFDKFWANQALLLFLLYVVTWVITLIIWLIGSLLGIAAFVFWIMGIIAVCNGQMKPLPLIGGIRIIQ
jgi:uncharacterized membrane protein